MFVGGEVILVMNTVGFILMSFDISDAVTVVAVGAAVVLCC